jgi:prepilin-type N-terminal cleavage/methylation domain-containing protein
MKSMRASDGGFTMVEVLVASVILVVGMLGILTLLTGALRTTAANNQRLGATNLARELVEGTRALDYDDMTDALVPARLQARGLGSGSPWKIQRRGVSYTIASSSCVYDDPADKLAAAPPSGVCTPQPTGSSGDSDGEDFRRTTFHVAWREAAGAARALSQTTLVVNPSGGLGPRIVSVTPATQTITANAATAIVGWTTTPAQTLRWAVDDGATSGSLTGSTSFTTSWGIGSSGSGSEVLDGAYQITAEPHDDRGVAGETKRANVVLNRRRPYAPPSLTGGHDTRLGDWVDLEWTANKERDILGYRVGWAGPDAVAGNDDDAQACPAPADGTMLAPTVRSCAHLSPPSGATTYYVVAIDRTSDNDPRDGDRRALSIDAASARPAPPGGVAVTTVSGQPALAWTAPSHGTVSFYRIYRDGTRYDRTGGATPAFGDGSPGSVGHEYWVTAVDGTFNESDAVGPVSWTP